MAIVSMKALLESGVHFGHRTHKWHPAMKPYIFTERNNIHIIDLQKTVKAIEEVYDLVRDTVAEGGLVLFVGTKRQAQETIQTDAERCGMPYVNHKWLGGMLTNWQTIRQRVNELERLERMRDKGEFERLPKKEVLLLNRQIERLEMLFSGIRNMGRLPDLLFVVDVRREETAIHEANILEIPVIALVDTNCDPRNIDYIIPSNDDAIRAIKLLVGKMADAVLEGKAMRKEEEVEPIPEVLRADLEEEELTDEELLGEATLAKLATSAEQAVEEEEEAEIEEAEAVEAEVEEAEVVEAEIEEVAAIEAEVEEAEAVEAEIEEAEAGEVEAVEVEAKVIETVEDKIKQVETEELEIEEVEAVEDETEELEIEEVEAVEDETEELEIEEAEAVEAEIEDREAIEAEVEEVEAEEVAAEEAEAVEVEAVEDQAVEILDEAEIADNEETDEQDEE